MPIDDARQALSSLVAARGEDYASLSRLIGRNPSYLQQFVRRGVPRKLDGDDRRTLARYFGIAEQMLGGAGEGQPAPFTIAGAGPGTPRADFVLVPRLAVDASAGAGSLPDGDPVAGSLAFSATYLRELSGGGVENASVLRVSGDSMAPTLGDGDDILVVARDAGTRFADGIHVLRADGALLVKRIAAHPAGGKLSIRSDNPAYPAWECDVAEVEVIGRVVWAGRRL